MATFSSYARKLRSVVTNLIGYGASILILAIWPIFYWYRNDLALLIIRVISNGIHTSNTRVVLGLSVFVLGFAAALFKKTKQALYGVIEITFGTVSGFLVAMSLSWPDVKLAQWSSLIGCIYVVSRGFNNVFDTSEMKANGTTSNARTETKTLPQ